MPAILPMFWFVMLNAANNRTGHSPAAAMGKWYSILRPAQNNGQSLAVFGR